MLPRSRRLTGDQVQQLLSQKAFVFHTPLFSLRSIINKNTEKSLFSVVIAKKVVKKAVDRNHIRRQLYTIIGSISPIEPGMYIITVKKTATYTEYITALKSFFTQK